MCKVGTRWLWLYAHHGITLMSLGNSEFQREEWSPPLMLIPGSGTARVNLVMQTANCPSCPLRNSGEPSSLRTWPGSFSTAQPDPHRALLFRTLDWGLGLTAEVACGAERTPGAGGAGRYTHAQVSKAVWEGLGLIFYLLPVPCRAQGAH